MHGGHWNFSLLCVDQPKGLVHVKVANNLFYSLALIIIINKSNMGNEHGNRNEVSSPWQVANALILSDSVEVLRKRDQYWITHIKLKFDA